MRVLLHTNVLSEVRRPQPDPRVLAWLDVLDEDRSFISVVSIAEIRRGVALMDTGRRRDALTRWLADELPQRFAGRVLPIDTQTASAWGDLMAAVRRQGLALVSMDGLLAATVAVHGLTLATRNTRDFERLGIALLDPWAA